MKVIRKEFQKGISYVTRNNLPIFTFHLCCATNYLVRFQKSSKDEDPSSNTQISFCENKGLQHIFLEAQEFPKDFFLFLKNPHPSFSLLLSPWMLFRKIHPVCRSRTLSNQGYGKDLMRYLNLESLDETWETLDGQKKSQRCRIPFNRMWINRLSWPSNFKPPPKNQIFRVSTFTGDNFWILHRIWMKPFII